MCLQPEGLAKATPKSLQVPNFYNKIFYPARDLRQLLYKKSTGEKKELPEDRTGCNERSQMFRMHSARTHPKSCRACGPPAAAQTHTGRGGCTTYRQRYPSYTADKVHPLCGMKLITRSVVSQLQINMS